MFLASSAQGATLPDGFVHEQVIFPPFTGQTVGLTFLPDGRIILIELETGVVRLAAVGAATAASIATIPGVRADDPERGLLGAAVDPNWPLRPYLYFQYTHTSGFERVEMWTASGALTDPASTSISLASPYLLLGDIADVNGIHNGGTLRFGPDGMLYVSLGEDGNACKSQDLAQANGKLLRLDVSAMPGTGSGPPPIADLDPGDNPFPGTVGYEPLVYAWGLRNPYRFTIDAPTGDIFIGDVGQQYYDEIDFIPGTGYTGFNFGWPQYDGIQQIFCCGDCGLGNTFTFPIHAIFNSPESLLAVVGGPVVRPVPTSPISWPASLEGDYLYFEIFAGTLHRLRETGGVWDFALPLPGQPTSQIFGLGFPGASDAQMGPDGALYFTSLGNQQAVLPRGLHRIRVDPAFVGVSEFAAHEVDDVVRAVPNPARAGGHLTLELRAGTPGPMRVDIFDATGARIRTLERAEKSGATWIVWDGRDSAGRAVSAGVYLVRALSRTGDVVGSGKIALLR